jgi:hypothetical protein
MSGKAFDELEDLEQILDSKLILPDGIIAQSVYDSLFGHVVKETTPSCPSGNSQTNLLVPFSGQPAHPTHDTHHMHLATIAPPASESRSLSTMSPSGPSFLHTHHSTPILFPTPSSTNDPLFMSATDTSFGISAIVEPWQLQLHDTSEPTDMDPLTQQSADPQLYQDFNNALASGDTSAFEMFGSEGKPVSEEAVHPTEFHVEENK